MKKNDKKTSCFNDLFIRWASDTGYKLNYSSSVVLRRYMKGVSFSNKRYSTKGVPFLKKWNIHVKGQGVGPWGGASPYKTFLSTPLPPGVQ